MDVSRDEMRGEMCAKKPGPSIVSGIKDNTELAGKLMERTQIISTYLGIDMPLKENDEKDKSKGVIQDTIEIQRDHLHASHNLMDCIERELGISQ